MIKILYISVALWGMVNSLPGQGTVIRGVLHKEGIKQVWLYQVKEGAAYCCDSAGIGKEGIFTFNTKIVQQGFYTIGVNKKHQFPLYLKSGDHVNIEILDGQAWLSGKNTKENRILYDWENIVAKVRSESFFSDQIPTARRMAYSDFFPLLEKVAGQMQSCLVKVNTGNKKFDRLMKNKIRCDMDFYALRYLKVHRLFFFEMSALPLYYQKIISKDKYRDCALLQLPWGRQMLLEYMDFAFRYDPARDYSDEKALSYLGKDCLKGEYLLSNAERYKSYDEYTQMLDKYENYFVLPLQKVRLEAVSRKLAYSKPGVAAPDFACYDRNEKRIILSDFRGKVVVLDVWATWCEPCRKQMPYMIKLEKEYRGKEIVFITMCIGATVERATWLKLLGKYKLEGIQVFMPGWNSQFAKDYKVSGVPRFMVFDKKGNIVSVNAPRPSNPELKNMINTELQK